MSQFVSHMLQPIACGVSSNQILQSQSDGSLFNETLQKRRRELDSWLRLEIGEMTLHLQEAVFDVSLIGLFSTERGKRNVEN